MATESLRSIARRKRGYVTASRSDLHGLAPKLMLSRKSGHVSLISAKSLYQLLKALPRTYQTFNSVRVAVLKHNLHETYKNEIDDLNTLRSNLAKYNASWNSERKTILLYEYLKLIRNLMDIGLLDKMLSLSKSQRLHRHYSNLIKHYRNGDREYIYKTLAKDINKLDKN